MTNRTAAREAQGPQATAPKKSASQFTGDIFRWLDQVAIDPDLPASAFKIAYVIAEHVNRQSGDAWPSSRTIATACALSQPSVIDLVPKLVANGHLALEPGRAGRGHSHRYRLILKDRHADHSRSIKDRPADHLAKAKRSNLPAEKIGQPITKDRPADQNHLKNHLEPSKSAGLPPARSEYVDTGNLTDPETADEATLSPTGTYPRAPNGAHSPGIDSVSLAASSLKQGSADLANAPGADAASMTPDYDERDFQFLRDIYPKADDETASRIAFCAALRETGDVPGTLDALIETAHRYGNLVADRELEKIKTLAEFIEIGDWRNRRRAMIAANAVACGP